jgi:phenylacetate-CoA ligase
MSFALDIYHRLPPSSRNAVVSLRGYYLNWWRYDSSTDRLVDEALERESWSSTEWNSWQSNKLEFLLERAATKVPYYRRHWEERRRNGDRASWSYLENWPVLEKSEVRANPKEFVADDKKPSRMFHEHTSGTTGASLDLWVSRNAVRNWYALFEARSRRWYDLSRKDRWAIIGGQLVAPVSQRRPPFWVWNAGLNQLYLSSYHLAPDLIPAYLNALVKYRVKYILGYPSALYALAYEALKQNFKGLHLDVAITNAEPLYEHQREAISAAFGCPVRETYGMAEIVAAGGECEAGSLHQWPETGIIEAKTAVNDKMTDLICTGLINVDMPLIRYRVGDRGSLSTQTCLCGRTLPLIDKIEGRSDDVLYTRDGRKVGRLDPIFKSGSTIREAQIIQGSLDEITLVYVPDKNFREDSLSELSKRIRMRLGDVSINFEQATEIPRTGRGKFRAVICRLPDELIMSLESANGK